MTKRRPLGLDELMIVNPVHGEPRASLMLLGDESSLYELKSVGGGWGTQTGRLYLSEDGALYEVGDHARNRKSSGVSQSQFPSKFSLGGDRMPYEVIGLQPRPGRIVGCGCPCQQGH